VASEEQKKHEDPQRRAASSRQRDGATAVAASTISFGLKGVNEWLDKQALCAPNV